LKEMKGKVGVITRGDFGSVLIWDGLWEKKRLVARDGAVKKKSDGRKRKKVPYANKGRKSMRNW